MLEVIAYIGISLLVILAGVAVYIETQRKKAVKEKKKVILLRISKIQHHFKDEIKRAVEQNVLTVKQHKSVYRIANNFFVFQSITDKSIEFCEHSLNSVISALPKNDPDSIHFKRVQEQISLFVFKLPTTGNGFNRNFYSKELPKLVKQLVDAKEEIYRVESDLSNDNTLTAVVSPASAYLQPLVND